MFIKRKDVSLDDKILIEFPVIIRVSGNLSVHNVELRRNKEAVNYYLFHYVAGTCITNYVKEDFKELSKFIPIDNESIFLIENEKILPVSEDYRA